MSAGLLDALALAGTAVVALVASVVLVARLERLATTWRLTEAMLGVAVALAADTPEVTSSVTAIARGQTSIGAGVVLGSNVFNLAALLGLSALVAGELVLRRRVVAFEGVPALWIALAAVAVCAGTIASGWGLVAVAVVVVPYLLVAAGVGERRDGRASKALRWVRGALREAEAELTPAVHAQPRGRRDVLVALGAVAVVVAASVGMEAAASSLGTRAGLSALVVGGVVLAAVTSLPNAVGALYLARRARGSAVLSEATNSNMLNVLVGLLVPSILLGVSAAGSDGRFVAAWALAMTALCLSVPAVRGRIGRVGGAAIVCAYVGFVVSAVTR